MKQRHLLSCLIWLFVCCCTHIDKGITTVYTTNTGKKYHTSACRYLAKSSIPVSLHDAVASGYTPCNECGPPAYTLPEHPGATDSLSRTSTDDKTVTTTRCIATTKKGKQCKRMTSNPSGKCYQHE